MAANIDKSLEDIIASDKTGSGRGRGRGGARGRGGRGGRGGGRGGGRDGESNGRPRRNDGPNPLARDQRDDAVEGYGPKRRERRGRGAAAGVPYTGARAPVAYAPMPLAAPEPAQWKHDMFATAAAADGKAAPVNRLEAGSSILVSNLDPEVTADDVKTIFAARGEVVKAVVNYDKDGTSLGTAEVTFAKADDAQKAVEEYDGAEVDGRAMYLKVISTLLPPPPKQLVVTPSAAKIAAVQAAQMYAFAPAPRAPRAPRPLNVTRGANNGAGRGGRGAARGGSGAGGRAGDSKQRSNSKGASTRNTNTNTNKQQNKDGARGGAKAARGGGRGGKAAGGKKEVSAADLDAELDSYHGASKTAAAAPAPAPAASGQPAAAAPAAAKA